MVAAGICDEVLVQVSYAIGVAEPCGLFVDTYRTAKVDMTDGEIAEKISEIFGKALDSGEEDIITIVKTLEKDADIELKE